MRRNKDRLTDGSYIVGGLLVEASTDHPGQMILVDLETRNVLMFPSENAHRLAVALRAVHHYIKHPKPFVIPPGETPVNLTEEG